MRRLFLLAALCVAACLAQPVNFVDCYTGTLASGYTAGGGTLSITSATSAAPCTAVLPSGTSFYWLLVRAEGANTEEVFQVTSRSGTTLTVTGAQASRNASNHGAGAVVIASINTAAAYTQILLDAIAPATVNHTSGNFSTAGSYTAGAGGSVAGALDLTQGTAPSFSAANTFSLYAPTSISSSYQWKVPAADAAGCIESDGAGTLSIGSCTASPSNPYLNPGTPVSIVSANWADFNMGSCTRNTSGNFEQLVSNATAGNNICGRTIAIPAGAFTKTIEVIPWVTTANFSTVGFGITDGTKVATCSIQYNTQIELNGAKCTNSSTCASSYSVSASFFPLNSAIMFFRMIDDGAGNISCNWSPDGAFFFQMWTDKDTTGAGGFMTPTKLIYFVNSATSNFVSKMTIIGYQ